MTDIDEVYGSGNYLKASSVNVGQIVTVKATRVETFKDNTSKVILTFEEIEQELALNKTNAGKMCQITNNRDWTMWVGVKVQLNVIKVDYRGQEVDAIRIGAVKP
jgi:hypothetical protein